MPIVQSSYVTQGPEVDGKYYVVETHVDQEGVVYRRDYMAVPGTDYQALLDAHAVRISQRLVDAEIEQVLNGP